MTILDALAQAFTGSKDARPELERAFNISSDLGAVAVTLATEGMDDILDFKARVGSPIRVMAAQRLSDAGEVIENDGGRLIRGFLFGAADHDQREYREYRESHEGRPRSGTRQQSPGQPHATV